MIIITIYFTDMDPTCNLNKILYKDALYEYKLIAFIKYLLSLKHTKKINNVKIVCYAGFRDRPNHSSAIIAD